jgi:hypothetical protein
MKKSELHIYVTRSPLKKMAEKLPKIKTFHEGASSERGCFIRKIMRELGNTKRYPDPETARAVLTDFLLWSRKRVQRYRARKGGL